jgi:beta-galactosidase
MFTKEMKRGSTEYSLILTLNHAARFVCPLPNQYESLGSMDYRFDLFHGKEPQSILIEYKDGSSYTIKVATRQAIDNDVPRLERNPRLQALTWETASENVDFQQSNVKRAEKPLDFSSFGQFSCYLGYESEFYSDEIKEVTILFPRIEDPTSVFCNGKFAGKLNKLGAYAIKIPITKGMNRLTCLVQNMGRYNFTQALGEPKGMSEAPALNGVYVSLLDDCRWKAAVGTTIYRRFPKLKGGLLFAQLHEHSLLPGNFGGRCFPRQGQWLACKTAYGKSNSLVKRQCRFWGGGYQ